MDLTVPASDGFIWDVNRKHCRDKAMEMINDQKPLFFMLSAECTPYFTSRTSTCARLRARQRWRRLDAEGIFISCSA